MGDVGHQMEGRGALGWRGRGARPEDGGVGPGDVGSGGLCPLSCRTGRAPGPRGDAGPNPIPKTRDIRNDGLEL